MATTLELMNAAWISFFNNKPQVRLSAPTGVSIPNNANTAVGFTSSTIDNWNGHSNVTNPSRYTIPVAGKYALAASVTFSPNSTGFRLGYFAQNGTEIVNSRVYVTNQSGTIVTSVSVAVNLIQAVVGDYFEFFVYQNSGGALSTDNGTSGPGGVQFSVVYESQ